MKLDGPHALDINVLKGALVINPNGGQFYITGISVDIAKHEIFIELRDADHAPSRCAVEFSKIKDWSIQFQGGK